MVSNENLNERYEQWALVDFDFEIFHLVRNTNAYWHFYNVDKYCPVAKKETDTVYLTSSPIFCSKKCNTIEKKINYHWNVGSNNQLYDDEMWMRFNIWY